MRLTNKTCYFFSLPHRPSLGPSMCSVLICFGAGTVERGKRYWTRNYSTSTFVPVKTTYLGNIESVLLYFQD